jgi:hypothetical protein
MTEVEVIDKGGRRMGIDRRQIQIDPAEDQRQTDEDRRSGKDRRFKWSFRENDPKERRCAYYID